VQTLGKRGPSWKPGESGDPARQEGEKTDSWYQTVEEDRCYKMPQKLGDGLATTPSHLYAQSTYHCALCISCHTNNHNKNHVFIVFVCFRRINHLAVKNHLHSSSGVREVVSSTGAHYCRSADNYYGTRYRRRRVQ
jgi:hypothetical protein